MTGRFAVLLSAASHVVYPDLVCNEIFETAEDADRYGRMVASASRGMEFVVVERADDKWAPDPLGTIQEKWA